MNYRAIFNHEGMLKILAPSQAFSKEAVIIIAEKDIPAGILFRVIEATELPTDRTYRNAWTADINESNADGKGLTKAEFDAKYPELSHFAVTE